MTQRGTMVADREARPPRPDLTYQTRAVDPWSWVARLDWLDDLSLIRIVALSLDFVKTAMSDRSESSGAPADDTTSRIEQVADAALRLFARYGYKRTSMDDIAKEAGLAKATLYLHFKGKDDVFRAMLTLLGKRVEARCREVMVMKAPFPERLAALLRAHFATAFASFGAGEHLAELKVVIASVAGHELMVFESTFASFARQLFEEADKAGEIALSRTGLDVTVLVATLMQAAAGAKLGAMPSCETYDARLDDIAAVLAAAVAR